jgi:methylenetetrahydrofolate reductase (NADPH)
MGEKLKAAEERALRVHIVSQFCFDAVRVAGWLRSLRAAGVDAPIKIGVAGPTSVKGLARYALRCGVRASFKAMVGGKASQLLGDVDPGTIIEHLEHEHDVVIPDNISFHFFSFGGIGRTARWVADYRARLG